MNWNFWTQLRKPAVDDLLKQLNEQLSEQLNQIGDQVNKLARIQYKTGQELQSKMERLNTGLEALEQRQTLYDRDLKNLNILKNQVEYLTEVLINRLDDIDLLYVRLKGEGQETWQKLLEQWAFQLLEALEQIGICELNLTGSSFDPRLAESIGTVNSNTVFTDSLEHGNGRAAVPYQIVEVVKRGFIYNDGRLLRKAQVITLQEVVQSESR
jgi:molecular chaperone GrpE (heat shock protein)